MILTGTASWTDETLIKSRRFYPADCKSAEDRLRYYASRFPFVEVDSSYYALPSARNAQLWAERTPEGFGFDVKAFRIFTGHQTPERALPRDIAVELAPQLEHKRNVYYKDLPEAIRVELWDRFIASLEPLRRAGKLRAVLFQYAPWVIPSPDWKRHIEECVGRMPGFLLATEFRNRAWFDGQHDGDTIAFERDLGVAHVVVDEPQGSAKSIPSVWAATNPKLGIVRLHGRNTSTWDAKGLTAASDRFNYDYADAELRELAAPIRELAGQVAELHVTVNANFEDQGVRAAAALRSIFDESIAPG
jgi:uncharacterized protein YecE (DUF72 family)